MSNRMYKFQSRPMPKPDFLRVEDCSYQGEHVSVTYQLCMRDVFNEESYRVAYEYVLKFKEATMENLCVSYSPQDYEKLQRYDIEKSVLGSIALKHYEEAQQTRLQVRAGLIKRGNEQTRLERLPRP